MILEYKGINIFYSDDGQGDAVVFLHGFLENSNMWSPFISSFSEKNRVVCIDLLGHGKTGSLGYIHTMELMAECVEVVLNHLKINKSTFVCHSMGGYVALAFSEKHPDKLNGLCLMNSTAQEDSSERKTNRNRAILAVKQNHKTFIRLAISNLFVPENRNHFSKQIAHIVDEALQTPLQGIIAALEGMKIRPDRQPLLTTAIFKKMMIISKNDPVLEYNSLINEAKKCNAKIVEFPDGHMSHIENKREFLLNTMYFIEKK